MNKIVAVLSIFLATVAHAGDYGHAASRQSYCSSMGGIARVVYQARLRGESKETWLDKARASLDREDREATMVRFAIDYGYDQASDAQDAHMKAWANCMDGTS